MRIIALGDTHGRQYWKVLAQQGDFDKLVLVGDYFDTHDDVTPQQQLDNFEDIMAMKVV